MSDLRIVQRLPSGQLPFAPATSRRRETTGTSLAISLIIVFGVLGCATGRPARGLEGATPAAAWSVQDISVQQDSTRLKWRYVVRLRDRSGLGLHLTKVVTTFEGPDFKHWLPQPRDIDLRVPASGEVSFPCGHMVFPASGMTSQNWYLMVKRTYTGQDQSGRPVTIIVNVPLGDIDAPQVMPLLDFARFTNFNAGSMTLICESSANTAAVFDSEHLDAAYLLIAVDNVQRSVAVRTRWLSPAGEEVRVINGTVRTEAFAKGSLFIHVTHSVPSAVLIAQPGTWRVELYLDGKPEGVYSLEVRPTAAPAKNL